jgi:hypothetical protein
LSPVGMDGMLRDKFFSTYATIQNVENGVRGHFNN